MQSMVGARVSSPSRAEFMEQMLTLRSAPGEAGRGEHVRGDHGRRCERGEREGEERCEDSSGLHCGVCSVEVAG